MIDNNISIKEIARKKAFDELKSEFSKNQDFDLLIKLMEIEKKWK